MPFDLDFDLEGPLAFDLLGSLLLLVVLLAARAMAGRFLARRTDATPQARRRWAASLRNAFLVLLVLGLVFIWAPQLRTFALSLTAVAVAVVVATKELILCFSGAFLRTSTRAFAIGDLIEVAGVRGEVVDHNLFATQLHEVGGAAEGYRHTGQVLVVPNSALLSAPLRNHGALAGYALHRFVVTCEAPLQPFRHEAFVRETIDRHAAAFAAGARARAAELAIRTGADEAAGVPRLRFSTSDLGRQRVEVTLLVPMAEAAALEHAVVRDLVAGLQERAEAEAAQGQGDAAGQVAP